jgi:hypothetical protein
MKLREHQNNRTKKVTAPDQNTQLTEQRTLQPAKEKRQVTYKGKPIRITADFSTQNLNTRRSWKHIIQYLKKSNYQPRLVCPAKLCSLIEEEIKIFHKKLKLKEFITTKLALQKKLKGHLHSEEENRVRQEDSTKNKSF